MGVPISEGGDWTRHRLGCSLLGGHEVDDFVVIGAIIDLLGVGSMRHVTVPVEVNGPRAGLPLSHLVVVLNWGSTTIGLSNPVHDLVVIGGIVGRTLRPGVSPESASLQLRGINTLSSGLDESNTSVVVMVSLDGINARHESQSSNKFHIFIYYTS